MTNLTDRIYAYLKRHEGEWISKRYLGQLARMKGFTFDYTSAAFDKLTEEHKDIGTRSDGGTWYRYYPLTEEEIQHIKDTNEYFDTL